MSFAKDLVHEQLEQLIERATQNYEAPPRVVILASYRVVALGSAFYNGVLSDRPGDARTYVVAVVPVGCWSLSCVLSTDRKSVLALARGVCDGCARRSHILPSSRLACELRSAAHPGVHPAACCARLGLFRCCQKSCTSR